MAENAKIAVPLVLGRLLAGRSNIVLLIIGGLVLVLGVLRLLGFLPSLALVKLGSRDRNPVVDGIAMLVLGAAILLFAIFLH